MNGPPRPTQRLDKWLWQSRFFKTRTVSAREISAGHCRVNGTRVTKPATGVGAGDVLTFAQGRRIRVVRITALPERRGPAAEARAHYDDLDPAPTGGGETPEAVAAPRPEPGGRPTKRARRAFDRTRDPGA